MLESESRPLANMLTAPVRRKRDIRVLRGIACVFGNGPRGASDHHLAHAVAVDRQRHFARERRGKDLVVVRAERRLLGLREQIAPQCVTERDGPVRAHTKEPHRHLIDDLLIELERLIA